MRPADVPDGSGPAIAFRLPNRRGLGHFVRSLNVANEIRLVDETARLLFCVRKEPPREFLDPAIDWVAEDSNEPLGFPASPERFQPDVLILDTVLPKDLTRRPPPGVRLVLMMRRCRDDRQASLFEDRRLDWIDRLLIPHTSEEFGYRIPDALEPKTEFIGPISRHPDAARQQELRRKYSLSDDDFLLVSTAGGGGFLDSSRELADVALAVHCLAAGRIRNLRHIFVRGPLAGGEIRDAEGLDVVGTEPLMVDLFALANAVIAGGGYNTVNELRVTGTPAFFVPGERSVDDQLERVRRAEQAGCGVVVSERGEQAAARIVANLADRELLAGMRRAHAENVIRLGNRRAAESILELAGR